MNTTIVLIVCVLGLIYLAWIVHLIYATFKMHKFQKDSKIQHKFKIGTDRIYLNDVVVRIVAYKNKFIGGNDPVYIVRAKEDFLKTKAGDIFDASERELE